MNSVMTRSNTYLPDKEKTRGIQINNNKIIERFQHYTSWLDSLTTIDEKRMYQPIAEGKWSSAEIVAHITKWDIHLREVALPAVRNG